MLSVLQIRNRAGVLVLDVNDRTAGYRTIALPDHDRVWDQDWAESAWVDGAELARPERLALVTKAFRTRIRGTSWGQVEARFEALIAAVEQGSGWRVVVGGGGVNRTWRAAGSASTSSPDSAADVINLTRVVTWSVPAQPTPGITGLPEEP